MKRIFPAVKLRPQTPPIDKREIGDAAIPGERRIHTSLIPPSPQLGPLANKHAVSSDVTLYVAQSGRENLHHFLPVLLRSMLPLLSIMTQWLQVYQMSPTVVIYIQQKEFLVLIFGLHRNEIFVLTN